LAELPTGTVTFLFTDLESSTRLWEEHPEAMRAALARHDEILRAAVEAQGGAVVKWTGDGLHAVFASAEEALAAATAGQVALAAESFDETGPLRVRMGIHTGVGEQRGGDYFGPVLNRAARLMAVGHGGQVLCSRVTADLVRDGLPSAVGLIDLGEHQLRDLGQPERLYQVTHAGLRHRFPPLRSVDAHPSNLPQDLSGFVGRAQEMAAVRDALGAARLVSIVGVGGVGKTRLAIQAGSELVSEFVDGVWLCELASLGDPEMVPEVVAAAVGYVPPQGTSFDEGLTRFFAHKQLLLILDNCEHLLDAVARFVATTSKVAASLSVVVTSREPLGVRGEQVFPLAPLDLPAGDNPTSVLTAEAGALFSLRAGEARPGFIVTASNAPAVRGLCACLDGIPLAIELAAARSSMMSPEEILERLDRRLSLLTSGSRTGLARHQTLRAAIDSSYELLDGPEQTFLDCCSVFHAGFDLGAAIAMGAANASDENLTIQVLGSLVTKSLIERRETDGVTRYRLLETIRQYAAEHLLDSGRQEAAQSAHAHHYVASAQRFFERLGTRDDIDALEQLEIETSNLAAAGRWLLDNRQIDELSRLFPHRWVDFGMLPFNTLDELGRLAALALHQGHLEEPGSTAACYCAAMRGMYTGELDQIDLFFEPNGGNERLTIQEAVARTGRLAFRGDVAAAANVMRKAIMQARTNPDPITLSYALANLAVFESILNHPDAQAHAEEAVALARQTGSRLVLLYPLVALTMPMNEDPERALAAAEECIHTDPSRRQLWATTCRSSAASIYFRRGSVNEGLRLRRSAIADFDRSGDHYNLAISIASTASNLASIHPEIAVQLAAIAESNAIAPIAVFDMPSLDNLGAAAKQVGPTALDGARSQAVSITYTDAVDFTLNTIDRLLQDD
jgi:predicted ATPase/class 3 adenylate cyclase